MVAEWQVLNGVATAWFEASSLTRAAVLAADVVGALDEVAVDVRSSGVRVRVGSEDAAAVVSRVAHDLGLAADPSVLQQVTVVIETANPAGVSDFWQRALDYTAGDGRLDDPLQRAPAILLRRSEEVRPWRHRIHLDVVRPAAEVERADLGEPSGPYGVRLADPDGNEVDLVPGGRLGESADTSDWEVVFSALACYRVASAEQQGQLVTAAATLADAAGVALLIDLRPGLVIFDSGKDLWEVDEAFIGLAHDVQRAARDLGATAKTELSRFVQLFFDAADVNDVRGFWSAVLGYGPDPRGGVTDIIDPRRLNPELVFQELDVAEVERRRQRNRMHLELAVPADVARARVQSAIDAGGRVLDVSDRRWVIADQEGNELVIKGESSSA